jgi:dihydrofolate synthase / folylpolyglutamate synthase
MMSYTPTWPEPEIGWTIFPAFQGRGYAPEGAEIWIDGGHNPGAGVAIAETLAGMEERDPRPLHLICGMLATKDQRGYFHAFAGIARHVYTVPVEMSDAGVPNDELAARAIEAGLSAEPISSVRDALMLLKESGGEETPPRILISGSIYLVGAVLAENGTPPR